MMAHGRDLPNQSKQNSAQQPYFLHENNFLRHRLISLIVGCCLLGRRELSYNGACRIFDSILILDLPQIICDEEYQFEWPNDRQFVHLFRRDW